MGTRQPPVDLNVKLVSGGAVLKLKLLDEHLSYMIKKYKTITSVKYKIYKVAALYLFSYISHYLYVSHYTIIAVLEVNAMIWLPEKYNIH